MSDEEEKNLNDVMKLQLHRAVVAIVECYKEEMDEQMCSDWFEQTGAPLVPTKWFIAEKYKELDDEFKIPENAVLH
jgi:hypothetical protein